MSFVLNAIELMIQLLHLSKSHHRYTQSTELRSIDSMEPLLPMVKMAAISFGIRTQRVNWGTLSLLTQLYLLLLQIF